MSAWYRLSVAWQRLMHSSYEKNGVFMTEILKAIIFGIVEGITEWLPISSTGHMILLNEFLTLDVSAQFWDMFLVVIQLGAILAVVVLFWNLIWPFARSSSEAVVAAEQNEKSGSLVKREYWVLGLSLIHIYRILRQRTGGGQRTRLQVQGFKDQQYQLCHSGIEEFHEAF